jgi:uncharacterized protein (TIGR02145 family)
MKKNINKWIYFLLFFGAVTFIAACEKDDNSDPEEEEGTVTDVDGNIYKTVTLGEQEWMAENLKTTKYSDGTPILFPGDDNQAWISNTNGAYAWHSNNEANKDLYGALYNWYTLQNPAGLCPAGWRVPTSQDYADLITYLNAEYTLTNNTDDVNSVGNHLKSCRMVNSPLGDECNTSEHPRWNNHSTSIGTDRFEFAVLPAGNRVSDGRYSGMGAYAFLWTSTSSTTEDANRYSLNYNRNRMMPGTISKLEGHSVRCIKINE